MTEQRHDELEAEAEAIGRRAAIKLAHRYSEASSSLDDFFDTVATTVEAEIRSANGTPTLGDVVVRLSYGEAVQTVTAIVEATVEERSATEREILAELREKFFSALGISVSCRMDPPNARSA